MGELNDIPRRVQLDRLVEAERSIYGAVRAVEDLGADARLTDAVVLLQAAKESVGDFVDGFRGITRTVSTHRHINQESPMDVEAFDYEAQTELKKAINNFLWVHLPDQTTLAVAEQIANDLFGRLAEEWRR